MDDVLQLERKDDVFLKVHCDGGTAMELSEYFTFKVPGHQFTPAFKNKLWDGNIRLFNVHTRLVYAGLRAHIEEFAEERGYDVEHLTDFSDTEFSVKEAEAFIQMLKPKLPPRDYQLTAFVHAIRQGRALLVSPTGCHARGSRVVMLDGSTKPVEDVQVGDLLMGVDNKPREVLRLFSGEQQMYSIKPFRSDAFTVNEDHILHLRDITTGKHQNISVGDYIQKSKDFKYRNYLISNMESKHFMNNPVLPVDPYFMGLYLGDGTCRGASITTADQEIIDYVVAYADQLRMATRIQSTPSKAKIVHLAGTICHNSRARNKLVALFEEVGLSFGTTATTTCETKHIPAMYKVASVADRMQLLAGLIDTDGYLQNGTSYTITSKSRALIDDAAYVSRSLGFASSIYPRHNKKHGTTYWEMSIIGDISTIPTKLPRKRAFKDKPKHELRRMRFDVEPLGIDRFYGFELSGDHLYYTDNWIVNHNSGKSFIQYMIAMYYQSVFLSAKKTLMIVPTTGLVHQMHSDFVDYGLDEKYMHCIFSGEEKNTNRPIVITTWQSIFRMPKQWFDQFGCVLVDECHLAKAQSLTGILTKLEHCAYRFGFTGSLDGSQTHALVIQGLLGPIKRVATTAELIEQKHLADFQIKAIVLKYSQETREQCKKMSYQQEMDFIVRNPARNRFLKNLVLSLEGNTLLLFQYVDKHGKLLYDDIKAAAGDRSVYFVHGGVEGDEREDIRKLVEQETNAIIIASAGTFSTGVNIKNLHNIVFASPSKSKVRNLQSIGRGLRKSDSKSKAVLYDIADDLSWKSKKNYTLLHFAKRVELYNEEKFPYKLYAVQLKE